METSVGVYLGAILIAEVPLSVPIGQNASNRSGTSTSASPYRKIFASYSRRDNHIVDDYFRFGKTLGDEYLIDVYKLRSGEEWNAALCTLVDEAEVFQLFWSENARQSQFVTAEWQYALSLQRDHFVRPTYWTVPLPDPPQELSHIHFEYLEAAGVLGRRLGQRSSRRSLLDRLLRRP
jgi:hypothetical protein